MTEKGADDGTEDWFERGRRRIREGSDGGGADSSDEPDGSDESDDPVGSDDPDDPDGLDESGDSGALDDLDESDGLDASPDASDPVRSGGSGEEKRSAPGTTPDRVDGPAGEEADDFGFGVGGDGGGGVGGPAGSGPDADQFAFDTEGPLGDDPASGSGVDSPFDPGPGGDGGPDGDPFGFADFGDAGSSGEFGFGDPGGPAGGTETFDDEEFESEIPRIRIGIDGLDEMILGGVPDRSLITTIGAAGTGKTTFGLQFLDEALRQGDSAVYITLEESRESILDSAEEKGMPYREYERAEDLAVVAMDPIEMANSLSSIRNELPALITDFGAERLVLDSVSLLEMMYDRAAERRSEVFDFARALKGAGVTTMLTSEVSPDDPYTSRYGIVEYLTDAVFVLQYVRPSDFRETRLAVEIQKIRDANHSRETKPYEITDEGINVYQQANIF